MSDNDARNAVDDVKTEKVEEETAREEAREASEQHHGEGFRAEDLAKKGKESKENLSEAE